MQGVFDRPVLYLVVLLMVWQEYLYREDDKAEVWDEMVGEIRARRESTHIPTCQRALHMAALGMSHRPDLPTDFPPPLPLSPAGRMQEWCRSGPRRASPVFPPPWARARIRRPPTARALPHRPSTARRSGRAAPGGSRACCASRPAASRRTRASATAHRYTTSTFHLSPPSTIPLDHPLHTTC